MDGTGPDRRLPDRAFRRTIPRAPRLASPPGANGAARLAGFASQRAARLAGFAFQKGQGHQEPGAMSGGRFYPDPAAVGLDD